LKTLIIATKNKGKIREIKELLEGTPWEIRSMGEAGIDLDIVEDGTTFEENALIKAKAIRKITGGVVLADDSGLEVDFLNQAPGIYTARFLGEHAPDADRCRGLLRLLDGVPDPYRKARFVCSAAIVSEHLEMTVRGVLEGQIAWQAAGANGFGYDPIFWVPEYGMTLAQMDSETKNRISHRGKAFRAVAERLKQLL